MARSVGDVRLRLDLGKLEAKVAPLADAAVDRAAERTVERVRTNLYGDDLVNTSNLVNSMKWVEVPSSPLYPRRAVGSPLDYVKYPEFGTRGHGPVRAQALRFVPKGGSAVVFAKWVRGVRPYGFMKRALDQLRPTDFE